MAVFRGVLCTISAYFRNNSIFLQTSTPDSSGEHNMGQTTPLDSTATVMAAFVGALLMCSKFQVRMNSIPAAAACSVKRFPHAYVLRTLLR